MQPKKAVDNSGESGIMDIRSKGEAVSDVHYIGKIDKNIFEKEFGKLQTDEVVLTDERMQHIKVRHDEDYKFFEKYGKEILENPDIVLKDEKNQNTAFILKHIDEVNMNIILKLAIFEDSKHPKNSIMTAYKIRDKNVKKLENKNKVLYKHDYL